MKHEGSGIEKLTTGQCDWAPILAKRFPADGAQGHCLTTHSFPLQRPRDLSHEVPDAAVQLCTAVNSDIRTQVLLVLKAYTLSCQRGILRHLRSARRQRKPDADQKARQEHIEVLKFPNKRQGIPFRPGRRVWTSARL